MEAAGVSFTFNQIVMLSSEIERVNKELEKEGLSWEHGIFIQPSYIPTNVKESVIYWRWETGGTSGGSCWDDSDPQDYSNDGPEPEFHALDKTLKLLAPNITYLQYKELLKLVKTNNEREHEYYGNGTDWLVKYLPVSELESFIANL